MATQESTQQTDQPIDRTVIDADVHISYNEPAVMQKVARYMDQPSSVFG